jgi:thiamine-phosphate pyrophosphorylase
MLMKPALASRACCLNAQLRRAGLNAAMPLVLMTDDRQTDWVRAARALPRGSVAVIRARDCKARARLFAALRPIAHLRLLIADDPVLAAKADGLHLPQARMKEAPHWRAMRPGWIITTSAHSLAALLAAREVDAIFLSPVFATASHPGARALTPVRAAFIAAAARVPVYALGGISARNAALLAPAFAGIAAISSLLCET